MLEAVDELPMNFLILGKANSSSPEALEEPFIHFILKVQEADMHRIQWLWQGFRM